MSAQFPRCYRCNSLIDLMRENPARDEKGCICINCMKQEILKKDRSVFPFADHLKETIEPYIQYRCDQAVAKFVLEQAERIAVANEVG